MNKTKTQLTFADLPRDYAGLCRALIPRVIHDAAEYEAVCEVMDAMVLHKETFSPDQADYFELLVQLVEAYDAEHGEPVKTSPVRVLKFLLQEHGLSPTDLTRLGASRPLGPMILRGERSLAVEHIDVLCRHFGVHPELFL